jgi:lysophospholipase L1-like esterase
MKSFFIILLLIGFFACSNPKSDSTSRMGDTKRLLKYLALGDSYTIGEGVPEEDRYPNQLVAKYNAASEFNFAPPTFIAKTGWTVAELEEGVRKTKKLAPPYDLVTLLIGVNNQYREKPVDEFKVEFRKILLQAIGLAGNLPNHVIVLSIPDWGATPFAVEKKSDQAKVAVEIDSFNKAKKEICKQYGVYFIEITDHYRTICAQPDMVVSDKHHPSGLIYKIWADKLYDQVKVLTLNP